MPGVRCEVDKDDIHCQFEIKKSQRIPSILFHDQTLDLIMIWSERTLAAADLPGDDLISVPAVSQHPGGGEHGAMS